MMKTIDIGQRRDPKRMAAIIMVIKKERGLDNFTSNSAIGRNIIGEAKERYSAIFRIPYSDIKVNKYNDDGTLHPEYIK